MRLPLIPREEKFFDLFMDDARNMLAAARLLEQFFRNYDERERIASQLRDAEHAGDQISHDIGRKLEATFVTPLDREDIHALINRLDDIVDFIEEVADTCILYGIDQPSPIALQQAEIIVRQCEQITAALPSCATSRGWSSTGSRSIGWRTRATGSCARPWPSCSRTATTRSRSSSGRTSTTSRSGRSMPARTRPT